MLNKISDKLFEMETKTIPYSSYKNDGYDLMYGCVKGNYNKDKKEIDIKFFPNILMFEVNYDGGMLYQIFVSIYNKENRMLKVAVVKTENEKGIRRLLDDTRDVIDDLIEFPDVNTLDEKFLGLESSFTREVISVRGNITIITITSKIVKHLNYAKIIKDSGCSRFFSFKD